MREKSIKIQDVAKHAGVSTATISRTLSHPDMVSEKTRELVLKAVQDTGYRVNRAARNLRTQKSNTILALLPDMGNPFFSQILQGIETVLSPAGYALLVTETRQIFASRDSLVDYFNDGQADGMIILDGGLDQKEVEGLLASPDCKHIVCACEWLPDTPFPSVRSANRRGAEAAIQYLYDLGHRRIAHIAGPTRNVLTQERKEAAIEKLNELGVPAHPDQVISGDFTLEAGREAARSLIQSTPRPTAIFCASDQIAFGVMAELTRMGLTVPEDMSIIGFDDLELSEYFIPSLTTMRQNRLALGSTAAEILLATLGSANVAQPLNTIVKDVKLIVRESCATFTSRK